MRARPTNCPSTLSHVIAKSMMSISSRYFRLAVFLLTVGLVGAFSAGARGALGFEAPEHRLLPLRINVSLSNAALSKAKHMLEYGYFSHTSPGGLKPWDFIRQEKISYAFAGENLARGYASAYELQADLLKSPSHRENLLSPIFSEIGIAVLKGTLHGDAVIITVQLFATPVDIVASN